MSTYFSVMAPYYTSRLLFVDMLTLDKAYLSIFMYCKIACADPQWAGFCEQGMNSCLCTLEENYMLGGGMTETHNEHRSHHPWCSWRSFCVCILACSHDIGTSYVFKWFLKKYTHIWPSSLSASEKIWKQILKKYKKSNSWPLDICLYSLVSGEAPLSKVTYLRDSRLSQTFSKCLWVTQRPVRLTPRVWYGEYNHSELQTVLNLEPA